MNTLYASNYNKYKKYKNKAENKFYKHAAKNKNFISSDK